MPDNEMVEAWGQGYVRGPPQGTFGLSLIDFPGTFLPGVSGAKLWSFVSCEPGLKPGSIIDCFMSPYFFYSPHPAPGRGAKEAFNRQLLSLTETASVHAYDEIDVHLCDSPLSTAERLTVRATRKNSHRRCARFRRTLTISSPIPNRTARH